MSAIVDKAADAAATLQIFMQSGALLKGHFQLTSGMHADTYMEKCLVLQYPALAEKLGAMLAARFAGDGVQVVLGPAVGAIVLAHVVARALGARALFSEREGGRQVLRRGFRIDQGEKVLVVEDVVTTGGSVREVLELGRASGGDLVGLGYLVDRSGGQAQFPTRAEYLLRQEVPAWAPADCPLCQTRVPLTSRGSRHL